MTVEPKKHPQQVGETINPWTIPACSPLPWIWVKPVQRSAPACANEDDHASGDGDDDDNDDDAILHLWDLDTDVKHALAESLNLSLPPLLDLPSPSEPFTIGPLPHVEELPEASSASSSSSGDAHASSPHPSPDHDIWNSTCGLGPLKDDDALLTWETFFNPMRVEARLDLLSEAGPGTFDAALVAHAQDSDRIVKAGRVLQSEAFVKSLSCLALGRSSVLFDFNDETNTFHQVIDDGRMSGYSLDSAQSLVEDILDLANTTAALRQFVNHTYASVSPLPSMVALASAVRAALSAVEEHLLPFADSATSLLQIQAFVQRPKQVLQTIKELVDHVIAADSDDQVVANAFDKLQSHQDLGTDISLVFDIFERVSGPWLNKTMRCIGISNSPQIDPSPDSVDSDHQDPSENSGRVHLRTILSADAARKIQETATCLTFLRDFCPDNPLVNLHTTGIEAPDLQWGSDWDDFDRIAHKARQYHQSLAAAVAEFNSTGRFADATGAPEPSEHNSGTETSDWPRLDLEASIAKLSTPPNKLDCRVPDELYSLITARLDAISDVSISSVRPPVSSMLHLSLNPMLSAQHALLTTATLRSILYDHGLHQHLELLWSFYLCGSGIFASNLSTILFSPDVEVAERAKGVLRTGAGTMGLRLGSGQRREWPPASSEVTLALMNVLNSCWRSQRGSSGDNVTNLSNADTTSQDLSAARETDKRSVDLPGGLSFAIRNDVAEDEIERILDPQSIYALDFLRLSYTPPSALNSILSRSSLEKYERVFRLLLRMLRMQFVVGQLCRDTMLSSRASHRSRQRAPLPLMQDRQKSGSDIGSDKHIVDAFRQRATHFVTTLCSHFLNTAISKPWRQMQAYISALELHVNAPTAAAAAAAAAQDERPHLHRPPLNLDLSLSGLACMHESTLTQITTSLLLRNRQRKASAALELVLGDILRFASLLQQRDLERLESHPDTLWTADVKALYAAFDAHVRAFKDSLAIACERPRHAQGKDGSDRDAQGYDSLGVEALHQLLERL